MGRVSLQPERLKPVLTDRALTLAVGADEVIAWDRAGRLYSVWRDGRTARRGLSGRVLQKWRANGRTERAWLDPSAADALVNHAASRAAAALALERTPQVSAVLSRAAAFDAAAATADAHRFHGIYSDIGILPPDQYLAVVVQATEGCSFRTCSFCDLYRRPYRVKTLDDFRAHAAAVRAYLGDSVLLRGRSAFVGAANALALPTSRVGPLLGIVRQEFGDGIPIAGFLDGYTGAKKFEADFRLLMRAGLRRVYVGLESGHDPLLEFVRKPSRAADVVDAVGAMKNGGLAVAVIVMLGLGGSAFDCRHVGDTIAALNRMPLGRGDLIYFSDLVAAPGADYEALAAAAGITPLDAVARRAQRDRIRAGLSFPGAAPQIATYDLREFVY